MVQKRIIDNLRVSLAETLRIVSEDFKELSIATGYWDLPGTNEILDNIKGYDQIRLLIGQEPLSPRHAKSLKIDLPEPDFPEFDFTNDLSQLNDDELRDAVVTIKRLVSEGRLQVRIFRGSFLHAKTFIFGSLSSEGAIGIIGSSNFTKAGLTGNIELNALEDNHQIVKFQPHASTDENGHLSWFEALWNDEQSEPWDGRFTSILESSPIGDLTFGAYDSYIKTLMEVYPDELIPPEKLSGDVRDVLYSFQYRNAQLLINKLERMGLAMLADSVGLGKTVTSGAVINHYKEIGATRIYVIAPASLKTQWSKDLAEHFGLISGFEVISLQDSAAIVRSRELDQYKSVDLFVIDEAHNLRNANSKRHQQLLDWFIANPESKVLLLTATPINNSLMDFVNQIQLASKGSLDSINVDYRDEKGKVQKLDFFAALAQFQNRIKRAEQKGEEFDWSAISSVVGSGLRHYLVRTTRQGVKQMGGIVLSDGTKYDFPESIVSQIGYQYSENACDAVNSAFAEGYPAFEGIDPRRLDLEILLEQTQRSEHPLDTLVKDEVPATNEYVDNVFANIFQMVLLLGFTPYRPEIYQHRIHGKSIESIRALGLKGEESFKVQSQLVIHNMLRVTWLKRMESSHSALRQSINNFIAKLDLFESILTKGKILSFKEIDGVIAEYGEDLESLTSELDEFIDADENIYDVEALKSDLGRDRLIAEQLAVVLDALADDDEKLKQLANFLETIQSDGVPARKKVIVFSYFSDTIKYLERALPGLVEIDNFVERSAFVTGGLTNIEQVTRRFAPRAKKHTMSENEKELDFLFATDVLSEGQNLQDAGTLVNYDLHWNPVRMIQRNGRINRMGSEFPEVFIANMKPEDNLEACLKLLNRLNRKINTIKHTIGLDQDVLEKGQVNAKEFVENLESTDLITLLEREEEASQQTEQAPVFDVGGLYGDQATTSLVELEAEEDKFFVEDDFIYDLRGFLARNANDTDEVSRVFKIPFGKWNYLPALSKLTGRNNILGLAKAEGQTTLTGKLIEDTHFVLVDTSEPAYRTAHIEDSEALRLLRVDSTENDRKIDRIKVDRQLVTRRLRSAAKAQASRSVTGFTLKPSEEKALSEFELVLPGRGLLKLITTKVNNKKEVRDIQSVLRRARSEIKQHGQLLGATIAMMDAISNSLMQKQVEDTQFENVTEVLFYAQQ